MILDQNMASKEEIIKGLDQVIAKFTDTKLKEYYRRFSKNIQFIYPDIDLSYIIEVNCGKVNELKEGTIRKPDVVVTLDSDVFMDILNKKTNALDAYSTGKIKYKGALTDLLKLQRLL
jgi:putative sterol carrier protein